MYWMEGRDHDWRNGDALLHGVKFYDLGSGKYTLHVKAVSADGAVSNQERKLEITIDRPWWLSWWMLSLYVVLAIIALIIWRHGYKKIKRYMTRKRTVIDELKRQREEIKITSDELRQPMARMTTIISDLAEKENDLEGREQLNSLHFQMLQVITRISEMQTILENPEAKAESSAKDRMELNDQGEISLSAIATSELTATIQPRRLDKKTHKFNVVFIDSNKDFNNFMNAHLREIYDFHIYDDIRLAIPDIEAIKADLVICKQDMKHMTGSELCNQLKSNPRTQQIKFVLMTDSVLTQKMMSDMNITLAADDYIAKPFNLQEAVIRFNKLMGLGPVEMEQDTIEGRETRMLEGRNASMTTATMTYDDIEVDKSKETIEEEPENVPQQEPIENAPAKQGDTFAQQFYGEDETIGNYSMSNMMDRQLMKNVEQYVLQNMSRGQISLEEMASAMGMGRVPFFHKIRSITTKTPAEIVREIRLKHACVLLTKTNINMSELAINIGFSTAENFINIFREKYGMTPLEYRFKYKK
jgi:AraC-like DNA-binding protein/DNA-binding response OmpR family regulator